MNRLDELIKKFCPDGVDFEKIKDVYKRLKGTPITAGKMKEIEKPNGEIRIFAGGKTVINSIESDIPKANITRVPSVLIQSRGVIDVIYYDNPFTFKNEMWAYTHKDRIAVKYLYYVLKSKLQYLREAASGMGALPQISLAVTETLEIPFPPLPVQREIVRILDNFTELTAELTARKKQYEYYQNILLTCDGFNIEPVDKKLGKEIQWLTLGEVCTLKAGKTISSTEIFHEPFGKYQYPCFGGNGLRGYVKSYNQEGNFSLIGRQGALCGNVCYASGKFYATEHAVVVEPKGKCDERFLYYILIAANLNQYKTAGAQPGLSVAKLEKVLVLIPSMSAQKRIVDILDRFDALCNDITIGLPAEIEARQKQYEYYRDKLLSFKEKK